MKKSPANLLRSVPLTVVLWLVSTHIVAAPPPAQTGTLAVEIGGLKSKQPVYFDLWNSKSGFLDPSKAIKTARKRAGRGRAIWVIKNLPYGAYAVSAWQDLNGNGKLDSNFFGAPVEPVGQTNNAQGNFGPPAYQDAKIDFSRPHERVRFKLKCPMGCRK